MACALTQGYNLDCRDSVGGVKEIYLMELSNASTVTEANGVVTAITKATGKRFWKYNLQRNTASATETITGSKENGTVFFAQEVKMILNKLQASVRNEIKLLAQNRLIAVVVDRNGTNWLYGREGGLTLDAGTATMGTASGDRNGYDLTFSGDEDEPAPTVDSTTLATLETPGA